MNIPQEELKKLIFEIDSEEIFSNLALEIFRLQAKSVPVYSEYLKLLNKAENEVTSPKQIPFLPIAFFKREKIITGRKPAELIFESSTTSGLIPSKHYVADKELYKKSITTCFKLFFGDPSQYCILALLPSYLERKNSSLVFMADQLIRMTNHPLSGFFLTEYNELSNRLNQLEARNQKTILLGVSFALLDFSEKYSMPLKNTLIIETGGMKGKRKEITRAELYSFLKEKFGVVQIYSEYGMTELLSQAYSTSEGIFKSPPWMKVMIRNLHDPFELLAPGETGGINIIDLANIDSCAFIQTDDLGKIHIDGTFEVLGRIDNTDIRGCNLLVE
ncbi:MAG TPA: hypothetical protein VNJ07_02105 [Chitinophagales bacterium]|nr:hypothetical protein [Chitinophagales bacterium]